MDEEYRASLEARVAALEGLVIELLGSIVQIQTLSTMADDAKAWAEGEERVPADKPHLAGHDLDALKHREMLLDAALSYGRGVQARPGPRPRSPRGGSRGGDKAH